MSSPLSLQIAFALLAIVNVWLDIRESVWARPLGLFGTILSLFIYYPAKLYAKCLLNIAYIFLNIYGWYQWLYRGAGKTALQVSKTDSSTLVGLVAAGILITLGLGRFLTTYSSAELSYWDSLHTSFCLVAHWLLVNKKLESWLFWLALDVEYAGVCYYRGLYPFVLLRIIYVFMAINGYRSWKRTYCQQAGKGLVITP